MVGTYNYVSYILFIGYLCIMRIEYSIIIDMYVQYRLHADMTHVKTMVASCNLHTHPLVSFVRRMYSVW